MADDLSNDAIKALYKVMRALEASSNTHLEVLIDQAVGQPQAVGHDYRSNFRAGNIAQWKAKLIHLWITKHHRDIGFGIAPELFPRAYAQDWFAFADQHSDSGSIQIITLDQSFGIVERLNRTTGSVPALKAGQAFCLELTSDRSGVVMAFQGYQQHWHSLPLGPSGEANASITAQIATRLPQDSHGNPIPLIEREDLGQHVFLCLVAPPEAKDILPVDLSTLTPLSLHASIKAHAVKILVTA